MTCSIDLCGSPVRSKGLCALHYDRSIRQGPNFDRSLGSKYYSRKGTCIAAGCDLPIDRAQLCQRHYAHSRRKLGVCGHLVSNGRQECLECAQNKTAPSGGVKTCNYCGLTKPESTFGVRYDKHRRTKVRARCRDCETNVRTKVSVTDIIRAYGTVCHLCGEDVDMSAPRKVGAVGWERGFHREHVISLSDGGENTLENCRASHGICNLRKRWGSDKTVLP
jgi:hypothetical protein